MLLVILILAGCSVKTQVQGQKNNPSTQLTTALANITPTLYNNIEIGETEVSKLEGYTQQDDTHFTQQTNNLTEITCKDGLVNEVTVSLKKPIDISGMKDFEQSVTLENDVQGEWLVEGNKVTGMHFARTTPTQKQQIYALPLEQKVGQMMMIGMEGMTLSSEVQALLDAQIGSIILFKKNIQSVEQLRTLISQIDAASTDYPTWIAIDEEGGHVSRLPNEMTKLPTAKTLASNYTADEVGEIAAKLGQALAANGIDIDFAPVFDVNSNPNNPVIGDRAYSNHVDEVISYASSFANGLHDSGIIAVAKHFPGHGDTSVDSHIDLPVINKTLTELEELELQPFQAAVKENIDGIMVGHLSVPALDKSVPTSLSYNTITGMLRKEWGYDGLIISDDLTMGALHLSLSEAIFQAIKAGNDIALAKGSLEDVLVGEQKVIEAVRTGVIPLSQINASAYRIISKKQDQPLQSFSVKSWNEEMSALLN